jgi:hypothetical protein
VSWSAIRQGLGVDSTHLGTRHAAGFIHGHGVRRHNIQAQQDME